jgi:predicted ABC-type ATPase
MQELRQRRPHCTGRVAVFARKRMRAGRLMVEEINLLMKRGVDFGFETTLSGRSHLNLIRRLKKRGYEVHFFYLWLPSVDLALFRVRDRVALGGHDVPETVVRRRFERSIANFFVLYRPFADSWILFDNSTATLAIIASEDRGQLRMVEPELYNNLVNRYGKA